MKKTVYIAHPLIGGARTPQQNFIEAGNIARLIAFAEPDVLVLSPIHAFSFLPYEDSRSDLRGRELCMDLIRHADELRVFGDWESSEGCRMEIEIARHMGIPVQFSEGHVEGGVAVGE
ncbi:DUF4406 domain-containing protein [Cloacibacillus porcorum]